MPRALIVHGGAGLIPPERAAAARAGCHAAALAGWRVLAGGGSAVAAVEAAIRALEDDPGFNAGTGSVLTAEGRARLDAGLMDGAALDVGAVAGVERVQNPIALARLVLASPHALLIGTGAEQFAEEAGMPLVDPRVLITPAQYQRWRRGYAPGDDVHTGGEQSAEDSLAGLVAFSEEPQPTLPAGIHADEDRHGTVGAVALDAEGHLAAGASTGGIAAKHPGRVGDTPLPGCGFYAEDGLGGVSSTGHGEGFIRLLLARRAAELMGSGRSAQDAAAAAIHLLTTRIAGSGGLILLDASGQVGFARNTPSMAHAYIVEGMAEPLAGI